MGENVVNIRRLNVNISADLHRQIKIFCATEDMDMKEFVIMACELLLENKGGDEQS